MEPSEGDMSLKNPATPPGIDPGTVRILAQRLNNYATSGPTFIIVSSKIPSLHFRDSISLNVMRTKFGVTRSSSMLLIEFNIIGISAPNISENFRRTTGKFCFFIQTMTTQYCNYTFLENNTSSTLFAYLVPLKYATALRNIK